MKITHLLRAAAFCLPLAAPSAEATTTAPLIMPTAPDTSFLLPENIRSTDNCKMRILSYFSEDNLKDINASLASVRAWFVSHNMQAPEFEEYDAGTKEGFVFLAKDPGNVIAAIEIYKNHVDQMRESSPRTVAAFEADQGKTLDWLAHGSVGAINGISQQIENHCVRPSPAGPY